jgi:hypothetical protein
MAIAYFYMHLLYHKMVKNNFPTHMQCGDRSCCWMYYPP